MFLRTCQALGRAGVDIADRAYPQDHTSCRERYRDHLHCRRQPQQTLDCSRLCSSAPLPPARRLFLGPFPLRNFNMKSVTSSCIDMMCGCSLKPFCLSLSVPISPCITTVSSSSRSSAPLEQPVCPVYQQTISYLTLQFT